jgi:hypothetical protein
LSFDGNDLLQRTNIGTVFSTSAGFEFQTVVDLVSRSTGGYTSLPITVMNNPSVRVIDGFLIHSPVPLNSHGFVYAPGNTGIANAWPTFTAYNVSPVNAPPAIIGYNATSNTAALFQNGVQTSVSGSRTFAQTGITLTIGSRSDAFTSFPGNMSEIVGFGGTLSTTDRQTLERNQAQYYGIGSCRADYDFTFFSSQGMPGFQGNCFLITNEQIRWLQLNNYIPNISTAPDNKSCPTKSQFEGYISGLGIIYRSAEYIALANNNCIPIGYWYPIPK